MDLSPFALAFVIIIVPFSIWILSRFRLRHLESEVEGKAMEMLPEPYDVGKIAHALHAENHLNGSPAVEELDEISRLGTAPQTSFRLTSGPEEEDDSKTMFGITGVEAVALYGADVLHEHLLVDDYVYEGMGHLAGHQFQSFADLSRKVETYSHDDWSGLSDGTINKVGGHIGEVYAADHLEQIGANVEWPELSNQKGWDLLVQGHEVNVKTISDADQLAAHFEKYPDIPAVIPGDAENIPEGALHIDPSQSVDQLTKFLETGQENLVIVDEALSHEGVMEQTEAAGEALLGTPEIVDGTLPVITLCLSGWREWNLLQESKTDFGAAAKNVGLDVAGVGGGALAGAKGGALAGAFIGPAGAALGGILGGVGGAIAGRWASNKVKNHPFKKAVANAQEAQEDLNETTVELHDYAQKKYVATKDRLEKKLAAAAKQRTEDVERENRQLRKWRTNAESVSFREANRLLKSADDELNNMEGDLRRAESSDVLLLRAVWPSKETLVARQAAEELQNVRHALGRIQQKFLKTHPPDRGRLFASLASIGLCRRHAIETLMRLDKERRRKESGFRETIQKVQEELAEHRTAAMRELSTTVSSLQQEVRGTIKPKVEKARSCFEHAQREAEKVGKA